MPTYDYQCRSCGHVTEVIHSMLDDGPTVCERCGGNLRRVLYPAGIIFKGPGFYRTDSRSSGSSSSPPASTEKNEKGASSTSEPSSATGTSTKAADAPSTS